MLTPDPLDQQSPTTHIHWKIVIDVSKSPQTQKTGICFTDARDTDEPDSADNDSDDAPYTTDNNYGLIDSQKSQYSLRKSNQYFKNANNTKKDF